MRRSIAAVLMVALLTAAGAAAAAPVAVAARLPGVLWHDGLAGKGFLVRPASIYTTEDGSRVEGVLHSGGAETEHGSGRGSLHWHSWTQRSAYAVGTQWIKLGTPTATSPFTRQPLQLSLFRVRHGHFTRMLLRFRQGGRAQRVTECLQEYRAHYEWGTLYHGRCA